MELVTKGRCYLGHGMLRTVRRAFVPSISFLGDQAVQGCFCVLQANPFWRNTYQARKTGRKISDIQIFFLKLHEMQSQVQFSGNCFGPTELWCHGVCCDRSPSWQKAHQERQARSTPCLKNKFIFIFEPWNEEVTREFTMQQIFSKNHPSCFQKHDLFWNTIVFREDSFASKAQSTFPVPCPSLLHVLCVRFLSIRTALAVRELSFCENMHFRVAVELERKLRAQL